MAKAFSVPAVFFRDGKRRIGFGLWEGYDYNYNFIV